MLKFGDFRALCELLLLNLLHISRNLLVQKWFSGIGGLVSLTNVEKYLGLQTPCKILIFNFVVNSSYCLTGKSTGEG